MRSVMEGRVQMREVKVEKAVLLAKIKANREKHIAAYNEACEDYLRLAKAEIEQAISAGQSQIKAMEEGELVRLESIHFETPYPRCRQKDYDAVISMLEMCVDDTIMLKADEHACYVMDDWDWKQDFEATNRLYKSRIR